ncbi:MAG: AEC family transporter, partial [Phycisphaerae bacterium]
YVGLAVLVFSFASETPENAARLQNIAVLVLALIIPIYNMAAVIILLSGRHKLDRYILFKLAKQVMTNPLFIACLAGLIYPVIFPPMPEYVSRALTSIGQISLPLALVTIGTALVDIRISGYVNWAFTASGIKIVIAPLAGLLAAYLFSLGADETRMALVFMACPTAAVSYVMTEQLGGDEKLSAAIVALSTILSILSLSAVLALF